MELKQKHTMIIWLKRVLGFTTIGLWMYIIYTISKSSAPFMAQVPYCMVSTMFIFSLLTSLYKGLDYWVQEEENHK